MKLAVLFLLLLSSNACAQAVSTPGSANTDLDLPGRGVTQEVAGEWSCRFDAIEDAAAEHLTALSPGQTYIAEVGWDACELLSKLGAPRDVQTGRSGEERNAMLRYGTVDSPHLVTLNFDRVQNRWVVSAVNW
jgi:hypothetical protein